MGQKQSWENNHHIISKCKRDKYNVYDERNMKRMLVIQHNAIHQLFHELHTPKEQLHKLRELYETVLSQKAKELFDVLLNMADKEFYDVWLVKWNQ